MTREEAINIMNVIVHMLEPQYDTDRIEDAVEMAIKALEQEPCIDSIIDALDNMPSVYPKAKVGKWIRQQSYLGYTHSYECSECGRVVYKDEFEDMQIDYPYCHCGAKMESEDK